MAGPTRSEERRAAAAEALSALGRERSSHERTTAAYWLGGVVGALLLCSLLAHELAHAIVAQRSVLEVDGVSCGCSAASPP